MAFVVCLGTLGCSDNPVDFRSDEIEGQITKEYLIIFNKLDKPVYHFIVERGMAALISWAPVSSGENRINPNRTKEIVLKDIYGYKKGKQLIVFYWSTEHPGQESIKSIIVDTN